PLASPGRGSGRMPGATPTHALVAARWPLRRVRWRANRLTLTRLAFQLVAIGTLAASLLVALAVEAGPRMFMAGVVVVVAAVAGGRVVAGGGGAPGRPRARRAPPRRRSARGPPGRAAQPLPR